MYGVLAEFLFKEGLARIRALVKEYPIISMRRQRSAGRFLEPKFMVDLGYLAKILLLHCQECCFRKNVQCSCCAIVFLQ